jgi:hypothetical protein
MAMGMGLLMALLMALLWESEASPPAGRTAGTGEESRADEVVTNMNSGGYTFANPNLQAKKQYDTDYGTR